jgi:hypothetical protein
MIKESRRSDRFQGDCPEKCLISDRRQRVTSQWYEQTYNLHPTVYPKLHAHELKPCLLAALAVDVFLRGLPSRCKAAAQAGRSALHESSMHVCGRLKPNRGCIRSDITILGTQYQVDYAKRKHVWDPMGQSRTGSEGDGLSVMRPRAISVITRDAFFIVKVDREVVNDVAHLVGSDRAAPPSWCPVSRTVATVQSVLQREVRVIHLRATLPTISWFVMSAASVPPCQS